MRVLALPAIAVILAAGCLGEAVPHVADPDLPELTTYVPHVIVGVPDTGINPYHEIYYRANLTEHPCTYIAGFPCSLPALNLTLGGEDWEESFEKDQEAWEDVKAGKWYWIPKSVFVAVSCDSTFTSSGSNKFCILDDSNMHGTGTTSSVLSENPDALIAFKEGGPTIDAFLEAKIPVDIFSVSWGYIAPLPVPGAARDLTPFTMRLTPLYFKAAGNDPRSSLMDTWSGHPNVISVGGAYAEGQTEEALATKQPDVVSYFCRPTAQTKSIDEMRDSYCGTSFAGPTAAGALSKVVLAIRVKSGYNGSIVDGMVDPVSKVSVGQLREALNLTASYSPEAKYTTKGMAPVPKNPAAPWLQWGWGFYDGNVADATISYLLDGMAAPVKPDAAKQYMEASYTLKETLYS